MDNENNKKKVGRPRIYTDIPDSERRDRIVNEMWKQKKYHSDPVYKEKKAERNKRNYQARKLKKELNDLKGA